MGELSALRPASSVVRDPSPMVSNILLLVGSGLVGVVMVATDTMSVYLIAILAVTAVVAITGLAPMIDYDGPAPTLVVAYLVAVLALIVI